MPGPRLPTVLREVVDKLLADDWCRCSTQDEKQVYYVLGFNNHLAHVSGETQYPVSEFPMPKQPGPLGEWLARSQVAGTHPNYLERARLRLQQAGVSATAIEGFLFGHTTFSSLPFPDAMPLEQRLALLTQYLEAFRASKGFEHMVHLDRDEIEETRIAREKLCLREISTKYEKIVDRWEQLDPLPLAEPQLEEASRAFLYGFYRASIVLSASALEMQLKRSTGRDWLETYRKLVEEAVRRGKLNEASAVGAKHVFQWRRAVVHENAAPTHDDAKEVLSLARKVFIDLQHVEH